MSPEQVGKARLVDHRSDLWALGVITFRCLTGHAPFKSSSVFELLMQVTAGPIPVPSRIAAVPVGFDAWWARAAARDPDHRFQTAKELAEALHVALGLSSAPDLDELTPTVRLHGRDTTLRLDDPGQPRRPAPAELPEEEPIPLMVRAPSEGSPCAPGPLVTTIAPAIAAPARSSTKARIAVAFACMVLGGIAALYVVPRLAPSTARVQAGPGPSAPRVLPAIVAPAVPVTAAGTTSLVRPPPSASSAPAPPRAVTPLPLPAPSSTSSARSLVKVPAPPVTATAAGNPAYDPGI